MMRPVFGGSTRIKILFFVCLYGASSHKDANEPPGRGAGKQTERTRGKKRMKQIQWFSLRRKRRTIKEGTVKETRTATVAPSRDARHTLPDGNTHLSLFRCPCRATERCSLKKTPRITTLLVNLSPATIPLSLSGASISP